MMHRLFKCTTPLVPIARHQSTKQIRQTPNVSKEVMQQALFFAKHPHVNEDLSTVLGFLPSYWFTSGEAHEIPQPTEGIIQERLNRAFQKAHSNGTLTTLITSITDAYKEHLDLTQLDVNYNNDDHPGF